MALLLHEITVDKTESEISKVLKEYVKLLAKKGLISKSDLIVDEYNKQRSKDENILEATLSVRYPLHKDMKSKLEKFLKAEFGGNQTHITEKIDESILGGVKIQVDDWILDHTIKGRLTSLEKALAQ